MKKKIESTNYENVLIPKKLLLKLVRLVKEGTYLAASINERLYMDWNRRMNDRFLKQCTNEVEKLEDMGIFVD